MATLLASSGSKEGITKMIIEFYCGTEMSVNDAGEVIRSSDNHVCTGVQVVKKGKRFRFEMI